MNASEEQVQQGPQGVSQSSQASPSQAIYSPSGQTEEAAPVTETPEDRSEELETPENIRTAPAPEVPREPTEEEQAAVEDMPEETIPATWPEKVTNLVAAPGPGETDLPAYISYGHYGGDSPAYNALDTGVGSPIADRISAFSPPKDFTPDVSEDTGTGNATAARSGTFEHDTFHATIDPGLTSDAVPVP
jgi:hypothetical protein